MFHEFYRIASQYPWFALACTAFGAGLGYLIEHRLSLGRDKRREFNEIADPLRAQLLSELERLSPYCRRPDDEAIHTLAAMLNSWSRRRLHARLAAYSEARKEHSRDDTYGQAFYERTDHIENAIRGLLRSLRRR